MSTYYIIKNEYKIKMSTSGSLYTNIMKCKIILTQCMKNKTMARYYGMTTQYGSYSCQHNYHGDKTKQTA